MKTLNVLLFVALLVGSLRAQEVHVFVNGHVPEVVPDTDNPLAGFCSGGWERVHRAIWLGQTLSAALQSPVEQDNVRCLLHALEGMTSLEPFLLNAEVEVLVDAYGIGGLDFFAAHAEDFGPRVAGALWSALTAYGHPDAIARHFARRAATQRPPSYVVAFYQPLLHGGCMKALCTSRLSETQAFLGRNLATIDAELRAAETAVPPSAAAEDIKRMDAVHEAARRLRDRLARIRRGEIGMSKTN